MAIVKRIVLVIVIVIHTFGMNAQTYESMTELSSKIAIEIQKGNNKKAFKYYQRAIEIQREHPDSIDLYVPIVYTKVSPDCDLVSSIIEYVTTQENSVLAEKWVCESAQMWIKHLELIRQYEEEQELKDTVITMNGLLGFGWAVDCAVADLDSLGDFSNPCDVFFDEAMNICTQYEEIDKHTDWLKTEDDEYELLLYLKLLALYYDCYRNDRVRAARAYIEYWGQYIESSEFSPDDLFDFQRMLFNYDCAIDEIWNLFITGRSLNYIESLIKEWQILRTKINVMQGEEFYDKMIDNYIDTDKCNFPDIFGNNSYEYFINIIVNIKKGNTNGIWQYVDLYLNSVRDPQLLMNNLVYIIKAFEDHGMATASFEFLHKLEQLCINRRYDKKYIIEVETHLADRYIFYIDVIRAEDILDKYLKDIYLYKQILTSNQYALLLNAICTLYAHKGDWGGFKYYADILSEHVNQCSDKIDYTEKLRFFYSLACFYQDIGEIDNYQEYVKRIIDECKYNIGESLPITMSSSYLLCRALLEYCNIQIDKEKYQDAIGILQLCVDYLKRTRINAEEEGMAYMYLVNATEKQKNYNLQKYYYKEFYKFLIRYFYQYAFSMSSNSISSLWQVHSNRLEYASRRTLINEELTDICYNFALLQKNHLLKYENLVRNNIYNSKDSILIKSYEEHIRYKDEKNPNAERLGHHLMDLYSSHLEFRNTYRAYEWQDVQKQLGKNDLAVEFTVCYKEDANSYAALLLKKDWDSPKIIELCDESELKKIMSSGARLYKENAAAYSCIWEKLEPYFKKGDNIYFAPHGLIHQLNIEVLSGADGKPMNKKCNLYRVSSTGNLVEKRESLKYTSATLYGGLNYDTDTTSMLAINRNYVTTSSLQRGRLLDESVQTRAGLNYLSGTAEEVRNVGDILRRNKIETTTYTDEVGTEESFKALSGNSTPIIHIATHGFYLEDKNARRVEMFRTFEENKAPTISPLKRSGLMFSGGQHAWLGREIPEGIDDGVLTAEEIAGMNLSGTDLLVLSACQTGLGEITNEGVEGLQRGFKIAGVNTIIMSLWEVSDAATEVLMTKFYSLLTKGKTKREAFDSAVEAVKKEYPSPEYWAAFIMLD